jgi:hypothetical protein
MGWGCGCSDADGPILGNRRPLMGGVFAALPVPRSEVATGAVRNKPCRVTTLVFRVC